MTPPPSTERSLAALFAALVEALDEKSAGIAPAFIRHLQATRDGLTEPGDDTDVARTIAWTLELLRKDLDRTEPAAVVYAKVWPSDEAPLPSVQKVQFGTLDEALAFWSRLPNFDQSHASIETASGHRYDAKDVARLVKRYRPPA